MMIELLGVAGLAIAIGLTLCVQGQRTPGHLLVATGAIGLFLAASAWDFGAILGGTASPWIYHCIPAIVFGIAWMYARFIALLDNKVENPDDQISTPTSPA